MMLFLSSGIKVPAKGFVMNIFNVYIQLFTTFFLMYIILLLYFWGFVPGSNFNKSFAVFTLRPT